MRENLLKQLMSLFVLLFLIFTFATTPSPIQQYFTQLAGAVVLGVFVAIVIGAISFFYNRNN